MDEFADLKLALRVLGAIVQRQEPDWEDIQELHRIAPPQAATLPPDELACAIIKQAQKRCDIAGRKG